MRRLVLLLIPSLVLAQNPAATITVDANANRRPINPQIYGVAHASGAALSDLNVPLNRWGGNNTSRYNWQLNADNRANDWYYESIAYSSSTPGAEADTFIQNTKNAGAVPMMTFPMAGWVAKLGSSRSKLTSFSVAKYGAQTGNDWQWFPDAGNGIRTSGAYVTGNDFNDANVPADSNFQLGWMQSLTNRWGLAANGGLKYYILDNEPSLWHSTHRDIHPTGATMDEIRDKILDYAAQAKNNDPGALVAGPEEWGWSGYLFSGYDQQWGSLHGWSSLPDRNNHGGWDYLPWLLDQLRQNNVSTGQRLLDVFTVHYYPQGGEFSDDVSSAMQLRRNRSTRSLWDPNYRDETWIDDFVKLVPRLRQWVNTYYPGTLTGLTEYNWGAEGHMNGATAQADILGIFGREGLDLAARWTTPGSTTPAYKAIKLYRNYDGNKSVFGDTSVAATVANPDNVAAFAAQRSSDGALTVMAINKYLSGSTPVTINLSNFAAGSSAQFWRLASNAISGPTAVGVINSSLSASLPAQSVTLFVIPAGTGNQPPAAQVSASPASGVAPLTVNFSGSGSTDPDGSIVSYAWNFGDSTTGSGETISHIYSTPGTYAATLTVTDNQSATNSQSVTITVTSAVPAAPSNLSGSVANQVVTLRWTDNSSNEQGFYIERKPKSGGSFVRVGQVGAGVTAFSQSPGVGTYLYRVQAFNGTLVSAYTNQVQVRVR